MVSFNGLRFDNNVIAGDEGNGTKLSMLNERTWDIKVLMEKGCGIDDKYGPHIISLGNVAGAVLGSHKTEGFVDGREAVRRWRRGEFAQVVEYCTNDAQMTADVYRFGIDNGYLLFTPARFPMLFNGEADVVVKVKVPWKASE